VAADAALAAARLGAPDARELLDEAIRLADDDPVARARLVLQRARVGALGGDAPAILRLLETAGAALPRGAEDVALQLDAEFVRLARYAPGSAGLATERLARLRDRVAGRTPAERVVLALLALESSFAGDSAAHTAELAERAFAGGALIAEQGPDSPVCYFAIRALVAADAVEAAEGFLGATIDRARREGSALGYASASMCRAHVLCTRGAVSEAAADARGALDLALENGWLAMAPWMAGFLVEALLERGRLDEAAAELDRPELAPWLGPAAGIDPLLLSRGHLRFARGDHAGALADLRSCGEIYASLDIHNPAFASWRSEAALALAAMDEREEALALVAEELELARRYGAPRALGVALRARGIVADDPAPLAEEVDVLTRSPARLEHARAQVELGAALRRRGRRTDARGPLRAGLDIARALGAVALAQRAHDELAASGARLRKMLVGGVEGLTPSELRVAELAADGASNVEIAQSLFVTIKTVETHLGRTYRKLSIAGRRDLARALRG
jgi:ATP/maltotriose-dependent transcriptional regulator MalT